MELTTSTNPQFPPSASSSPLPPETKLAIQCIELSHEVCTLETIHGILISAPLPCTHPCYQEACFECHHLGYIHIYCQWYISPICKVNTPSHPQHCCPLNHYPTQSSSTLLLSSSRPHPVPPPHSCRMVHKNSIVRCHNPYSQSPPHSHSPLEDFEYEDVAIANMTGSLVSSFINF